MRIAVAGRWQAHLGHCAGKRYAIAAHANDAPCTPARLSRPARDTVPERGLDGGSCCANRSATLRRNQADPFGVDPQWYTIRRQPEESPCWLVITRLTEKKLGPLFEWSLEPLFRDGRRQLHLFGPMQEQIAIPDWVSPSRACYIPTIGR